MGKKPPKSEPAEIPVERLKLRNFHIRRAQYRRWATMIDKGQGKLVARQLRAMAERL